MVERPSSPSARRPVGSGAGLASLASIGGAAAGALLGVLVARVLGPADTGSYQLVTSTLLVLLTVAPLGLAVGALYRASAGEWALGEALRQLQLGSFLLGVLFGAATLGFAALTQDSLFRGVSMGALTLGLAGLPFAVSWASMAALMLSQDRYEAYSVPALASLLVALGLATVLAPLLGLTGALMAVTGGHMATWMWISVVSVRRLPQAARGWLGRASRELRATIKFGIKSYLPNVLQLLSYRADLFVLNAVAAEATVGRYAVALLVTEVGVIAPRSLSTVVMSRVAALHHPDVQSEQGYVTGKSVRHCVLLGPLTWVALSFGVLTIPAVFGQEYREAVGPGLVLAPGVVAVGLAGVLAANMVGLRRPEYTLYSALLATPPTVAAYALLIPQYGIWGAAAASTASYFLTLILTWFFFRRATEGHELGGALPTRHELADYGLLVRRLRKRLSSS